MGSLPVGLSGSRSAGILGLSPYTTPLAVWQNIMELKKPGFNAERGFLYEKFEGNAATRFGNCFESSVIELTEQHKGQPIVDQEGEYSLADTPFVTCHIDGRFNDTQDVMFEGKTTNSRAFSKKWGEPGTDRIPVEYACQVQHNMMLTGTESCIVSVLVFPRTPDEFEAEGWSVKNLGGYHLEDENGVWTSPQTWAQTLSQMGFFHTYEIKANRDTQKLLRECYDHFWREYVLTEKPPECADYSDIKILFTAPKGELILPSHMIDKCTEYGSITKEIGDSGFLAKRKVELKTEIVGYLRDKTTVESDDAQEKVVCLDYCGNKVASFDGKTFRT